MASPGFSRGGGEGRGHGVRVHKIRKKSQKVILNFLMDTLKPHSNGPYSDRYTGH